MIGTQPIHKNAVFVGMAVIPMNGISYCVDVYRKKYKCEHKFLSLAEYLLFFPVFFAGPIVGYTEFQNGMKEHHVDLWM